MDKTSKIILFVYEMNFTFIYSLIEDIHINIKIAFTQHSKMRNIKSLKKKIIILDFILIFLKNIAYGTKISFPEKNKKLKKKNFKFFLINFQKFIKKI